MAERFEHDATIAQTGVLRATDGTIHGRFRVKGKGRKRKHKVRRHHRRK